MKILSIILLIIAILTPFIILIKCLKANLFLKNEFEKHSVIVFGRKGSGKDLLFQKTINLYKKKPYLANMSYGGNCQIIKLSKLSVEPNTYHNFINNKIKLVEKIEEFEGKDCFISDGGVWFPCQYDFELNKKYPSFPIFYALSRQLYNMNIHFNVQNLERLWKIVREQSDSYIYVKGKIKLIFGIFIRFRYYEKYQTAVNRLNPIASRILNKFSKAEEDQYKAMHGEIKDYICYLPKKMIHYDTRAFHKIIFGIAAPGKKRRKKKNVNS